MAQADHKTHQGHSHQHGAKCGHATVQHGDHFDYLHDGHLHHVHGDHVDEHMLPISTSNPANCTPQHKCADHGKEHAHSATCGHPQIPHGDHVDFLVGGHLHHSHGDHCDDHGRVTGRA